MASKNSFNDETFTMVTPQLDAMVKADVQHIVEEMPWMKGKSFILMHERSAIEAYIDKLIAQGIAALDLETTGLSCRMYKGESCDKIVGFCLAASRDEGVYIPIAHKKDEKQDSEYNVPLPFMLEQLKRLAANCVLIFHNFKFDGAFLQNYGINIGGDSKDENMYEDTLIMAVVQDASRKNNQLKHLSKTLLLREMLEIKGLGVVVSDDSIPAFDEVPPEKAVYYGASDAMNTFYLYEFFKDLLDQQDPDKRQGPWGIYKIEKRCMFVTMEMERNYVKIDRPFLQKYKVDLENRSSECVRKIWDIAGRQFDVASPKQLGTVLFDELKLKYPIKDKTKTEGYQTSEIVLEKLQKDHPIIEYILDYRGYQKYLSTYINNLLENADENDEIKFELNQTRADTGRYSATGGKGLKQDGYSRVNCQNLPRTKKKDPKSVDVRKALIAHDGYKIVTIDYSGEELRIAANLSKEEKWINEFLHGTGDLHTITAKIIYNKSTVDKDERGVGKTLNFLTLYGGGPGGFAAQAKISMDNAKKMIYNFFKQYTGIRKWIETEVKVCKKRGYSRTALGRRRPLAAFYNSTDEGNQKKGDRCAINSMVQGSGADIIKMALYRVSKWIREQGLNDKIKILVPIHDEIVYEIKNDGSEEEKAAFGHYIEELSKIMVVDDIITGLRWPVKFEVDAEYGDSFSIDHNYFEEKKENKFLSNMEPVKSTVMETVKSTPQIEGSAIEIKPVLVEGGAEGIQKSQGIVTSTSHSDNMDILTIQHTEGPSKGFQFEATIRSRVLGEEDIHLAKEILLSRMQGEAKEIDTAIAGHPNLKELIDSKNYLTWTIDCFDTVVAMQIAIATSLLDKFSSMFSGPKCFIKLIDKDGEVLYTSPKKVSADAFVSLCLWLNI
jgi:DNA polymerase-1